MMKSIVMICCTSERVGNVSIEHWGKFSCSNVWYVCIGSRSHSYLTALIEALQY